MDYTMIIASDRIGDKVDHMTEVITALLNAEVERNSIFLVLNTTIQFTLSVTNGKEELSWVLDRMNNELKQDVHLKIIGCYMITGEGNPTIGNDFQEKIGRIINSGMVSSYRNEYRPVQ